MFAIRNNQVIFNHGTSSSYDIQYEANPISRIIIKLVEIRRAHQADILPRVEIQQI